MSDSSQAISIEIVRGAGIQTWKMSFSPVNQLNAATLPILADAVRKATQDETIAAVVLASGLRVFSAGADASEMARMTRDHGEGPGLVDQFHGGRPFSHTRGLRDGDAVFLEMGSYGVCASHARA